MRGLSNRGEGVLHFLSAPPVALSPPLSPLDHSFGGDPPTSLPVIPPTASLGAILTATAIVAESKVIGTVRIAPMESRSDGMHRGRCRAATEGVKKKGPLRGLSRRGESLLLDRLTHARDDPPEDCRQNSKYKKGGPVVHAAQSHYTRPVLKP